MVLERLSVDVEDELAPEFTDSYIKINSGFDAANLVNKGNWENRSGGTEGNSSLMVVGLVEGDIDGLVLSQVLGNQHVLLSIDKELKSLRSD